MDCTICLDPIKPSLNEKFSSVLKFQRQGTCRVSCCNQLFHKYCLEQWRASPRSNSHLCPLCRGKYKLIDEEEGRLTKTAEIVTLLGLFILGVVIGGTFGVLPILFFGKNSLTEGVFWISCIYGGLQAHGAAWKII